MGGAITIRDLIRATDLQLPDDEASTVAGLIIHEAWRIPVEGRAFGPHGLRIWAVTRRDHQRLSLKVRRRDAYFALNKDPSTPRTSA